MTASLERFVPRVLAEWDLDGPAGKHRQIDGTLCFVDISGFTALSERLARRGRVGAEELTEVLDHVFGSMLRAAYDRGGSLLKFGGDALLLMFSGEEHALHGVSAAVEMRAALREATTLKTSVGRIHLRMSVGVHTGEIDLFRVGQSHRELVVTGETATTTTEMEGAADAGEILVSPALAALLPDGALGGAKGGGRLLRWRTARIDPTGPVHRREVAPEELEQCVPQVLRADLGSGGGEAEHRVANIGFIKFKGTDALAEFEGPDAVAAALDELITSIQEAADAEDVTFLATDVDTGGGKVILATGVPASQEDDEGRMLRTLRAIADAGRALPIKVGVNRGHVFSGEIGTEFRSTYTVMGDTVNLAARLMAAAPEGSIYAAPSVIDRSRTLFDTSEVPPFMVKGKSEPVRAFELGDESGIRRSVGTHDLPFVGRTAELTRIGEAVEQLGSGSSAVFTISGPNGIGKSRLVDEALGSVGEGVGAFVVRAEPYGAGNPFWAFRDPLRDLLGIERGGRQEMAAQLAEAVVAIAPELTAVLPLLGDAMHIDVPDTPDTAAIEPKFRTERVAEAVESILAAIPPGPMVIVIEDCHWIDEASATITRRLAVADRPWLIISTRRPGEGHLGDPLGAELPLPPLDDADARTLAVVATRAAPLRTHELEALVERSGGNPLFLTEMLRLVGQTGSVAALPESLDAVVGAEIDALPPLTRRLLRVGSVLGRSFRAAVFNELLAGDGIKLDSATRRELGRFLEAEGVGRRRFRHAVVRDVAYEALSYRRRRELHERAGLAIEHLAGEDTESVAEFLSIHYSLSGAAEKAWTFARIAGDKAKAAYANSESAAHYHRALGVVRSLDVDPPAVAELWTQLGEVEENAGRFEAARDAYGRALATDRSNPVAVADLHLQRARTWMYAGEFGHAKRNITVGQRALGESGGEDALAARARLDSFASRIHIAHGDPVSAHAAATAAAETARKVDEEEALARAYMVLDWANFMLGQTDAPRHSEEALEIFERLGFVERASDVMNNLGGFAYLEGKWDDAVSWYRRSMEAARRAGNDVDAANIQANTAEVLIGQRRFDEAAELADEASRALRAANVVAYFSFVDLQVARAYAGLGRHDEAVAILERLAREAREAGDTDTALEAATSWAAALVDAGDPEDALEVLDGADLGESAAGRRVRGSALSALGDGDGALGVLEVALQAAADGGDALEEALVIELLLVTRRRAGVKDPDPAMAERMRQVFDGLGIVTEPAGSVGST